MKSILLKDRSTKAILIKQNIRYKTKQNIRYKTKQNIRYETKFNPISINGLNLLKIYRKSKVLEEDLSGKYKQSTDES